MKEYKPKVLFDLKSEICGTASTYCVTGILTFISATTPGKHIKSILKNSRFRTRTETHQAENISHSIITKHGATTPVRAPSNKRKTVSEAESSSSPMHIYEVTESQTPKPVHVTPPVKKQVKISK